MSPKTAGLTGSIDSRLNENGRKGASIDTSVGDRQLGGNQAKLRLDSRVMVQVVIEKDGIPHFPTVVKNSGRSSLVSLQQVDDTS